MASVERILNALAHESLAWSPVIVWVREVLAAERIDDRLAVPVLNEMPCCVHVASKNKGRTPIDESVDLPP
jgi:hypothetical protein